MRALVVVPLALVAAACSHDGDDATPPDSGTSNDAATDGATDAGATTLQQGLLFTTEGDLGPIQWIAVDDAGVHPRTTLVDGIDPALRQNVWGFSDDGTWFFYELNNHDATTGSLWVRHLEGQPQRIDDASKPYWSGLTWTNDKLFFVGGSEVAYSVDLRATGVASAAARVSRDGKRVFSVPISASGDYVAMHYYAGQTPIVRAVRSMNNLTADMSECCAFGYYWDLSPRWGNVSDREFMVAGADYDHRDLSLAGPNDTAPTTVHNPPMHGGLSVIHGTWSKDDRFIGYQVKKTIALFSDHLYIADVTAAPQRIEATTVHSINMQWRPGANPQHIAYAEYPAYKSQQRVMLGTVETNPLRFTTRPIIEYPASPIFGIDYEWNPDGTAILHHGGATGEYAVTFIANDGTPTRVPLGIFFRDEDSARWIIPYLGWSKDGRRIICRTNTGYSIASVDVATKQISTPIELPADIDFAWWDRRLAPAP